MIETTLPALLQALKGEGLDALEQKETDQLYIIFKLLEKEFPLFIRFCQGDELIQFLAFVPIYLNPAQVAETARLLHLINARTDMPGFCFDEEQQVIFYRLMLPTYEGKVPKELLLAYINATKVACESFASAIQGVNVGQLKLEEVQRQMKPQGDK